jgi:small subunit ribosomal protein S5
MQPGKAGSFFDEGIMRNVAIQQSEQREFDEVVVRVYRCATVVKGGRRFSFAALIVVGDRNGRVGIGYGKAPEVPSAVDKARKIAHRSMTRVKLVGGTLPHHTWGHFGASKVVMLPASAGTGVIAGGSVRPVLELAGVHDVLTKSYGSSSPKNLVRATFEALVKLYDREAIAGLRGVSLAG